MLLPDQTYEQCQDKLETLKILKKILHGSTELLEPTIFPGTKHTSEIPKQQTPGKQNADQPISIKEHSRSGQNHFTSEPILEAPGKVSEFFDNIPDFVGEPLGPFSIPKKKLVEKEKDDIFKECENILQKHRIRPDFFCRYRKAQE